jgi:hypothetical protein
MSVQVVVVARGLPDGPEAERVQGPDEPVDDRVLLGLGPGHIDVDGAHVVAAVVPGAADVDGVDGVREGVVLADQQPVRLEELAELDDVVARRVVRALRRVPDVLLEVAPVAVGDAADVLRG